MVRLVVLMALLLGLAGCNTIAGLGQDVEATGEAISDTAEDTKEQL